MQLVLYQVLFVFLVGFCVSQLVDRIRRLSNRIRSRSSDAKVGREHDVQEKGQVERNTVREEKPMIPKQKDASIADQVSKYKNLYYKLQNLEQFPEVLGESRDVLLHLFAQTLSEAMVDTKNGILSIRDFSRESLEDFLHKEHDKTTAQWEEYMVRRKDGGAREMFTDKEHGEWWLKMAAPVKYVDGAWLGHINKISTPFTLRKITKDAWQVMSEELGDGDVEKNHVKVYEDLMREINAGIPAGDSKEFIDGDYGFGQLRIWEAALAQLLVSLFPHEFLPEILGFNMAYEGLPLHLMKTVKELQELKLNAYYFLLHIAIDNADSGHAKMAMEASVEYIEHMRKTQGEDAAEQAWRRVQTGFILAEGLPTTPQAPTTMSTGECQFPRTIQEAEVVRIFQAKAPVAHKIHCSSRLKIGRHSLVDWLEPTAFASPDWQRAFLDDLSNMKPWVRKGDSENSRLVRELSWDGKMFGSFTQTEVEAVRAWIDSMGPNDDSTYWSYVGRTRLGSDDLHLNDVSSDYPVLHSVRRPDVSSAPVTRDILDSSLDFEPRLQSPREFLALWFAHPCLLENFVSIPAKVSNEIGSAVVRVLRAQSGFSMEAEVVAGMDEVRRPDSVGLVELGLELAQNMNVDVPSSLAEAMQDVQGHYAVNILHLSMKPIEYRNFLLGASWAFMQLHEALATSSLLSEENRVILGGIASREREGLDACVKLLEPSTAQYFEFSQGYWYGKDCIKACV